MTYLGIGIHEMIPPAKYHADPCEHPSLSSGICKILYESTPMHAWTEHPRLNLDWEPKRRSESAERRMALGSAVHELFLGRGGGYVIGTFDNYRTKEAKKWRFDVETSGFVPILSKDFDKALAIAAKIREKFGQTFDQDQTEVVVIWNEEAFYGITCRAMIDILSNENVIYDLKTVTNLSDSFLTRHILNMGYDIQAAFYLRGVSMFKTNPIFCWIFAEIEPPYEMRVIQIDNERLEDGIHKVKYALSRWCQCTQSGQWPGYSRKLETLPYPKWLEKSRWEEEEEME